MTAVEELSFAEIDQVSGGLRPFTIAAAGLGLLAAVCAAPEIAIIAAGYALADALTE